MEGTKLLKEKHKHGGETSPPHLCHWNCVCFFWLKLGTSGGKGAADFPENDADLAGNARHDCTSGDSDKTGHQNILDQILSAIFINLSFQMSFMSFSPCNFKCVLLTTSK